MDALTHILTVVRKRFEIPTRGKEISAPGDHDHTDGRILVTAQCRTQQFPSHGHVHAVGGIRPIQCNTGNAIILFKQDSLEVSHNSPSIKIGAYLHRAAMLGKGIRGCQTAGGAGPVYQLPCFAGWKAGIDKPVPGTRRSSPASGRCVHGDGL
jgi:hypothetical protein